MFAARGALRARAGRVLLPYASVLITLFSAPAAFANYHVATSAAASTAVAKDSVCNLTEAITSINLGHAVNTDCIDDNGTNDVVSLTQTAQQPFSTNPYQLGAGISLSAPLLFLWTEDESTAIVEATGTSALTVNAGSQLELMDIQLQHKGGAAGRLISNHGSFSAFFSFFQNGNVSGLSGAADGGAIFSDGALELGTCVIQNNNAVNGRGGGVFATGPIGTPINIHDSVIQNNVAGQGGGMYADNPSGIMDNSPQLQLDRNTLNGNKAVSAEATTVPPPSGASLAFSQGAGAAVCAAAEDLTHAFDDNLSSKFCVKATSAPSAGTPLSITYQLASAQTISAYSITSGNDAPERDPANWELWASPNGTTWTRLHSVVGERFARPSSTTPGSGRFLTHSYGHSTGATPFNNTTAFKYYQLRITANQGGSLTTQLAELGLFFNARTGDGGGLYAVAHTLVNDTTFSKNIAGCTSAACACSDAWCASTSNTSAAFGKGGGLFGASSPNPETFGKFVTVAANSASQGGGVYGDRFDHWGWQWSIFGSNSARTASLPEPDFHGDPHSIGRAGGCLFGSAAGVRVTDPANLDEGELGLLLDGGIFDGSVCHFPSCDPDVVQNPQLISLQYNGGFLPSMLTHFIAPTSVALDRVASASIGPNEVDERSFPRLRGPGGDWGATERP
jgi:hypothetical protein